MAIIANIDCGVHPTWNLPLQTWKGPEWGQTVGTQMIEGLQEVAYPRGATVTKRTETIWLNPFSSIGGSLPGSQQAVLYLLRQLLELVENKAAQPVYIQWRSGGGVITADSEDGWYILESIRPEIENLWTGIIPIEVSAFYLGPHRKTAMGFWGGSLVTNASGVPYPVVVAPFGSTLLGVGSTTPYPVDLVRTGAEGALPIAPNRANAQALTSPYPILLSSTVSDWWKGGVKIYDTINTSSNPVPTTSFVNTNWLEVKGVDHNFVGDCVITNGLQLLLFQTGTTQVARLYLWNTALSPAQWQTYADLVYLRTGALTSQLSSFTLARVSFDECALQAYVTQGSPPSSSPASPALVTIRLQRGRYEVRVNLKPLFLALAQDYNLALWTPDICKILYNSSAVGDNIITGQGSVDPAPSTDYLYGAAFINSATYPFIVGWLYQNQPAHFQPFGDGIATAGQNRDIGLGDNSSLAVGASRNYAFFAFPYGTAGSLSPANLQAEAESGTLGTGWSSQAFASQSGGNAAKCASGTVSGNADTFLTAVALTPGKYDIWFLVAVTSIAGSTSEMTLGAWDGSAFIGSTDWAANQVSTSFTWKKVATINLASGNVRFRAVTKATLGTDWFIDQAVAVPVSATVTNSGPYDWPQDLWQQYAYESNGKLLVAI